MHRDPALVNLIEDADEQIHFIDWGGAGIGARIVSLGQYLCEAADSKTNRVLEALKEARVITIDLPECPLLMLLPLAPRTPRRYFGENGSKQPNQHVNRLFRAS